MKFPNIIKVHKYKRYAPYLFMDNHSTGERHAEGVSDECKNVDQALNWRAGLPLNTIRNTIFSG